LTTSRTGDSVPSLAEEYADILKRGYGTTLYDTYIGFWKLVGVFLTLEEPIPFKDLCISVGLKFADAKLYLLPLNSVLFVPQESKLALSLPLQFYHSSFREFLLSITSPSSSSHALTSGRALILGRPQHSLLAEACLHCLIVDLPQHILNVYDLKETTGPYTDGGRSPQAKDRGFTPSFGVYACKFWPLHLKYASSSPWLTALRANLERLISRNNMSHCLAASTDLLPAQPIAPNNRPHSQSSEANKPALTEASGRPGDGPANSLSHPIAHDSTLSHPIAHDPTAPQSLPTNSRDHIYRAAIHATESSITPKPASQSEMHATWVTSKI
jgi:hypothetical protein